MKTEKQKKRNREYMKEYHNRPEVKIKEKIYSKKYLKGYLKKYMKDYSKRPEERAKKIIRMQSQRIYGKVPKGYERHHINYDSPHNFILIPIRVHKEIHKELMK